MRFDLKRGELGLQLLCRFLEALVVLLLRVALRHGVCVPPANFFEVLLSVRDGVRDGFLRPGRGFRERPLRLSRVRGALRAGHAELGLEVGHLELVEPRVGEGRRDRSLDRGLVVGSVVHALSAQDQRVVVRLGDQLCLGLGGALLLDVELGFRAVGAVQDMFGLRLCHADALGERELLGALPHGGRGAQAAPEALADAAVGAGAVPVGAQGAVRGPLPLVDGGRDLDGVSALGSRLEGLGFGVEEAW